MEIVVRCNTILMIFLFACLLQPNINRMQDIIINEVINIYFVGDTVVKVALDPKRENTLSTPRRF